MLGVCKTYLIKHNKLSTYFSKVSIEVTLVTFQSTAAAIVVSPPWVLPVLSLATASTPFLALRFRLGTISKIKKQNINTMKDCIY